MTENNKPEWFEITDNDEKPALNRVSKSLPISAVLIAAVVLAFGALIGQNPEAIPTFAPSASAEQTQGVKADSTRSAASVLQSADANPTVQAVSVIQSAVATPSITSVAAAVAVPAASKLANPSISKLPTGGGDDDDHDDDDDDDDRHGRGHDDDDDDKD